MLSRTLNNLTTWNDRMRKTVIVLCLSYMLRKVPVREVIGYQTEGSCPGDFIEFMVIEKIP